MYWNKPLISLRFGMGVVFSQPGTCRKCGDARPADPKQEVRRLEHVDIRDDFGRGTEPRLCVHLLQPRTAPNVSACAGFERKKKNAFEAQLLAAETLLTNLD